MPPYSSSCSFSRRSFGAPPSFTAPASFTAPSRSAASSPFAQHPPLPGLHFADADRADADAHQPLHFITHLVHHQPDLPLDPLAQDDAQLALGGLRHRFHLRPAADDVETAQQLFPVRRVEVFVERHLVLLVDLVARMREREREIAVVGQDEQPLAFAIEPADVEDAGPLGRQAVEDRAALELIARGHEKAARFVEQHVQRRLGADHPLADFHHILRRDLGGEILDHAAVDFDPPLPDERLHAAAGAETGGSKKTIEAHPTHQSACPRPAVNSKCCGLAPQRGGMISATGTTTSSNASGAHAFTESKP